MPNEIRVRTNFLGGTVENNPLTAAETTLTTAGYAIAPAIGNTQHQALILDPDGYFGDPEIAYVTSHVLNSASATILRGQEGTAARQHLKDTPWVHAPTLVDYSQAAGNAQIYIPTLAQSYFAEADGAQTTQVITGQSFATIVVQNEISDVSGRYDAANGLYSVPVAGVYALEGSYRLVTDSAINSTNVGIGFGISNADVQSFFWRTMAATVVGTARHTINYNRQARFSPGDQLRMYTYIDAVGSFTVGARRITVRLVASDV